MRLSTETLALTPRQFSPAEKPQSVVQYSPEPLQGQLTLPEHARGVVVSIEEIGHGELQSFHRAIGSKLDEAGIATLLIDLLTPDELADARLAAYCRSHIQLLASRVVAATDWLANAPCTRDLPIGYFSTSIGAAAALAAASERQFVVSAIVSSSGRPFLVRSALPQVRAPTLLITDRSDSALIKVNRAALSQMLCQKCLEIVPEVSDESSALEQVTRLAKDWFERYLVPRTLD